MQQPDLSLQKLQEASNLALCWVRKSIAVCGGQGSSHSWSPLLGWRAAYPETTGYLLETLLQWQAITPDTQLSDGLRTDIRSCTDWLLTLQLSSGAFPGLLVGHQQPSIFNTGQIVLGLVAVARHPDFGPLFQPQLDTVLANALNWMTELIEPDGAWRKAAYQPGFTPAYYTRALWGAYEATAYLKPGQVPDPRLQQALHYYAALFQPNATVSNWGFWSQKPAFIHTIAYTLEGFWHCLLFQPDTDLQQRLLHSLEQLQQLRQRDGRTAGTYDYHWKGDFSFLCLTGCAQLSVLYRKVGIALKRHDFLDTADQLLGECLSHQSRWRWPARGALAGSWPLWGPYLRGRYPNWAVKFLLDAIYWRNERS
jgi:hypothetical protein